MKNITIILFFLLLSNLTFSQVTKFTYDNLNRLTKVVYPDSCTINYSYDASGNRTTLTTTNICYTKPRPTITLTGNNILCSGDSVLLTSSTSTNYLWSTGETTQSIFAKKPGKYAVTAFYSSSCSKFSDTIKITVNPLPVAKITPSGNTVFCEGDSITLQAETVTGYSYKWSTGATTSSIKAKTTGVYKLLVTNTYGCKDSTKISVTVNPLPVPIAGINQTICEGPYSQVQIGSPPVDGNIYSWTPTTGLTDPNVANPFANPSVTTSYVLKVTNEYSCSKYSTPVTITVNPRPVAKIIPSGNTTFCDGDSILLKAQTSNTYSYKWSNGASTPSIKVKTSGIYKLLVTNTPGCQDSTSISVKVNSLPNPITGPNKTICEGPTSQVQIGSPPIEGYTYSWTPTTGLNDPSLANPMANPSVTTSYMLKVTNSFLCSKTSNPITITVNPRPKARITPNGSTVFCAGDSVILQAETSDNYHYRWSTGESSNHITAKTSGVYKLLVTNDFGCTDSASIVVTVNPLPIVITGNDQMLCNYPNAQVEIGSSPIEGNIYSWSPQIGLNNASIANPVASPDVTTTYTLKVTNSFGCTASRNVTINRVPLPIVNAGNDKVINKDSFTTIGSINTATGNGPFKYNWTPNLNLSNEASANPKAYPDTSTVYTVHVTDKFGCVDSSSVFVQVIPKNIKFFYYPNPTKDMIKILGADVENGKWKISLYTVTGIQAMKSKECNVKDNSFSYELSIKEVTSGTYFLRIEKDGSFETHKIIKMN